MRALRPAGRHRPDRRRTGAVAALGVVLACTLVTLRPAGTALAATTPTPSPSSTYQAPPRPVVDCVIVEKDGFRAVFGYVNAGPAVTIGINGTQNHLTPNSLDGIQPTKFSTGTVQGTFATPLMALNKTVTWRLSGTTVTASASSKRCGPGVTLPTEGNGVGPILVLVVSVIFSMGLGALRTWRHRRRRREA